MSDATREVYWNISHPWVMYALFVPTLVLAGYGFYRRVKRWRLGQPTRQFDRPVERLRRLFRMAVLQRPIWQRPLSGAFHGMLFWGLVTLTIATAVVMVHHDFQIPIMRGKFYLLFQSLFVDVMGALAIIGVAIAGVQRWWIRPPRLVFTSEASLILILVFVILVSGFLLEGWRIAATEDPWGGWSPVGFAVGRVSLLFASVESLQSAHVIVWWGHLLLVFGLIAWAPYTKLIHVVTSPLNIYTSNLDSPLGALKPIDFDAAETFGVNKLEQFTWKDLLELDACTECGRCTSVCPANTVGKQLSPRDIILDLRGQLSVQTGRKSHGQEPPLEESGLIGSRPALSVEALFQCTTCAACVDACPVAIEQYPKIVDMRRFQIMEEAEYPRQLQEAIGSLEQRGHPFRGAQASRTDWAEGLDIPHLSDVEDAEILLWVGCGGALVERNQKTTRAVAKLLRHAGVQFGILGKDESCSGDPARRIGNEFLFDTLARKNIETFQSHRVHTVVTPCPHCFHTFKKEYSQFGANLRVYHHTTYLAQLIGNGRLQIDANEIGRVTLHDPCYLSRHNNITEAPRHILKTSCGPPIEMPRHGKQSFCCGGGGGLSFVDEPAGQRVNVERAKEAVHSGADTVAVACPFCTTMLEDGIGAVKGDRQIRVKDIAEVLWSQIEDQETRKT